MPTANVKNLMVGYAAQRGISQKEVGELFGKVYSNTAGRSADLPSW